MSEQAKTDRVFGVVDVNVGRPQTHEIDGRSWRTAYFKEPVDGAVELRTDGLEGDGQANTKYHGGPDKALCVYPHDHYAYWTVQLGRQLDVAAFGENVSLEGLLEEHACIGDVFEWGEAVVQISEPREPCANISRRWGVPKFTQWVRESGFTGWYMRVLEPGSVSPAASWVLRERPHPEYSVARLNRLVDEPGRDLDAVARLAQLDVLGESWRDKFGG